MKPKFKLGDKVKFSRVAYREMTLPKNPVLVLIADLEHV
jgi:hypothetical protein